jgi:carbonic anhydrase
MRKFVVAMFVLLISSSAFAQSSNQLWSDLMAGNELFVKGQVVYGSLRSARSMWATAQNPPVAILSCADSRVPAEIIFQRTVGELFVVRVAGNVEDTFNIASLEYAASKGWTKLVVVMGHSECGAVSSSLTAPPAPPPYKPTAALYELIMRIRKSFTAPEPDLRARTIDNVCYTAWQLKANALIGKADIKTAYYDVATGVVEEVSCPKMMAAATPSDHPSH